MRGKWLRRVRQIHTWLGVFFSPLLLFFILTGGWQTFAGHDDEDKKDGVFGSLMAKFSTVHTDSYFAGSGESHHPSAYFKVLVGSMAAALILTICLGLVLSFQGAAKARWTAAALVLGILVPVAVLYFT